jgi:hypothetical protein
VLARSLLQIAMGTLGTALRCAFPVLGALVGLSVFVQASLLWPQLFEPLTNIEFDVGAGPMLPILAVLWLASAAAGAMGFTLVLSAVRNRLSGRRRLTSRALSHYARYL